MSRWATMLLAALLAAPAVPGVAAAQWAAYPGAVRDAGLEAKAAEQAKEANMGTGMSSTIAVSSDSFEKVHAFYRGRGKEILLPAAPGQVAGGYERELPAGFRRGAGGMEAIPSGIKVKQVIIIFDGAADISVSKDWMSISRPLIAEVVPRNGAITYPDVRDATAIMRSVKQ
jgi:hypothetical protein